MVECNNLCKGSEETCKHCKEHYIVSEEFYVGLRPSNGQEVVGYLVKNKDGVIQGILNRDTNFSELAWVDEGTVELYDIEVVFRSFEFARKMEDKKPVLGDDGKEVLAYPDCQLPEYQTESSAGADFFCAEEVVVPSIWRDVIKALLPINMTTDKDIVIDGKYKFDIKPTLVHTGIKSCMYKDEGLFLYNRSSNPKKIGLILANGVGVVDSDYYNNEDNDGEIMFAFYNLKPWDTKLKVGDRIGQGVFEKFLRPVKGLRVKNSKRSGGFGSTGK